MRVCLYNLSLAIYSCSFTNILMFEKSEQVIVGIGVLDNISIGTDLSLLKIPSALRVLKRPGV